MEVVVCPVTNDAYSLSSPISISKSDVMWHFEEQLELHEVFVTQFLLLF
jgi:hypothetical protein